MGIELAGADRIEILVEVGNEPSATIARRLGFREEAVLRRRLPPAGGGIRRDALVFTLLAEELDGSPAAGIGFAAFDCRGLPVG